MSDHDLVAFFRDVSLEMAADYSAIRKRAIEDPGTAGDRGEESWAQFIRGWIPERHAVVTKGRILFFNDEMSQQMDLLILNADYPKRLRNKRVFLASGVLAAFECKLTLRASHVKDAFERSENLRKLEIPQEGKLRRELCHRILYGLLAHSSEWKSKKRGERGERLLTALDCGLFKTSHPRDLPEVICVADTATARLSKTCHFGASIIDIDEEDRTLETDHFGAIEAGYFLYGCESGFSDDDCHADSMARFIVDLLDHLSWASSRASTDWDIQQAGLAGSGTGSRMRVWPGHNRIASCKEKAPCHYGCRFLTKNPSPSSRESSEACPRPAEMRYPCLALSVQHMT